MATVSAGSANTTSARHIVGHRAGPGRPHRRWPRPGRCRVRTPPRRPGRRHRRSGHRPASAPARAQTWASVRSGAIEKTAPPLSLRISETSIGVPRLCRCQRRPRAVDRRDAASRGEDHPYRPANQMPEQAFRTAGPAGRSAAARSGIRTHALPRRFCAPSTPGANPIRPITAFTAIQAIEAVTTGRAVSGRTRPCPCPADAVAAPIRPKMRTGCPDQRIAAVQVRQAVAERPRSRPIQYIG